MNLPHAVLLISGKRKCGKDYLAGQLQQTIGDENCCILRISEPIKSHYAKENNLDLNQLMSENAYKENYRIEMIKWSDNVRLKEPGYFCEAACSKTPLKSIWIVSDIRRKTDIKWFQDNYGDKIKTIRLKADLETRKIRGWYFTIGVDDVTSECDLDDYNEWNLQITNNNNQEFNAGLQDILKLVN